MSSAIAHLSGIHRVFVKSVELQKTRSRFPITIDPMLRIVRIGLLLQAVLPAQPTAFEVVVTKNVMVAMRDGVKLAGDLYQPARNAAIAGGKFPALMPRNRSHKDRR